MKIDTMATSLNIITKIEKFSKEEGYEITLQEYNNKKQYNFILKKGDEDFIIMLFLKNINGKSLSINKNEYLHILNKLDIKEYPVKLERFTSNNIQEIREKIESIKFLKVESIGEGYNIIDLEEGYRLRVNIYNNGTISFQGNIGKIGNIIRKYLMGEINNINAILEKEKNIIESKLKISKNNICEDAWQRFLKKRNFSDEQMRVVESTENVVVVNAVAGSGKTTTLEGVINRHNNKKILYIVYNRKMREEADARFKEYKNVKVVTGHSLAFKKYANKNVTSEFSKFKVRNLLKTKVERAIYFLKVYQGYLISKDIEFKHYLNRNKERIRDLHCKYLAKNILADFNKMNIVKNFKIKEIQQIKEDSSLHIFEDKKVNKLEFFGDTYQNFVEFLLEKGKEYKLNFFEQYEKKYEEINLVLEEWKDKFESQIKSGTFAMTHDYYLKRYQLLEPITNKFDIILLDEAQDTNEVMIDIVEKKFGKARKIIVGDTHQSIYRWRGALNAMEYFESLKGASLYNLTKSFRIGHEIANICSKILSTKGKNVVIHGLNQNQKKINYLEEDFDNDEETKVILYRNNFRLMESAIDSYEDIYFMKEIELDKYYDILYLKENRKNEIKYLKELVYYKNYDELEKYIAENLEEDNEIKLGYSLLNRYKTEFKQKIENLKLRIVKCESPREAKNKGVSLILGTIHSSKGNEFDKLIIGEDVDDFFFNNKYYGKCFEEIVEEINLIYVALTRSSKKIVYDINFDRMNELIKYMVKFEKESLEDKEKKIEEIHRRHNFKVLIKERNINSLYHFTEFPNNLKNILRNGLMSIDMLREKNIAYLESDYDRKDGYTNYISTSISFPNDKMLHRKKNSNNKYVILELDPKLLYEKDCNYSRGNAAKNKGSEVKRLDQCEELEKIFERDNKTKDLPSCYPTDVQSEILVKEKIEINYILRVYFQSQYYSKEIMNKSRYKHIEYKNNDLLFGWRETYINEVKNG